MRDLVISRQLRDNIANTLRVEREGRSRNYLGQDLDCHPRQSDRTERKRQHDFDVGFDLRFKVSGENAHMFGRIA